MNFEYKAFLYESHKLSYFKIFNNLNRPYLLKKNINNGNVHLQIGDGYIRQGTKNRRLDRDDFELIYKNRLNHKDRKIDLDIIVVSGKSEIQEASFLKYVDFEILNTANKSIEIDIEIEFPYRDEYEVLSKHEIEKKIEELNKPEPSYFSYQIPRMSSLPSFQYSVFDNEKSKIFERNKLRGQKHAIILTQNNSEKFIFNKEIIILSSEPCEIEFFVRIRSDDFIDGPLIKKFNYSLDFSLKEK